MSSFLLTLELFAIGVIIFIAKAIASQDQSKWHIIAAKAVLNGFTSLLAGIALIWFQIPTIALIGIAAMLGTLGTEYIIKLLKSTIEHKIENVDLSAIPTPKSSIQDVNPDAKTDWYTN